MDFESYKNNSLANINQTNSNNSQPSTPSQEQITSRTLDRTTMPPTQFTHNRPPLRLDRAFLDDPFNRLKLLEMGLGLLTLIFTTNCWPNNFYQYCSATTFNFSQMFTEICVNFFFLILTTIFAIASLFSVPDAYYYYNFPLLEKFYVLLASCMYLIGVFISYKNFFESIFSVIWIFQVAFITLTFVAYCIDFLWRRKLGSQNEFQAQVQSGAHMHTIVNNKS